MPLLHQEETYAILGACFEVYRELGPGFLESVYHECLIIEFGLRGIPFESKKKLPLIYKEVPLQQTYEPDFVCFDKVIVEIKAVSKLTEIFRAQLHHYLRSTKLRIGLLVNFASHPQLEHERVIC